MPNESTIPLALLPRELSAHTGKPAPNYRRLYGMILDGLIPAEPINSRWFVRRDDLSTIAAKLGLTAPLEATGAHSRKPRRDPAPPRRTPPPEPATRKAAPPGNGETRL